jgi:transposase
VKEKTKICIEFQHGCGYKTTVLDKLLQDGTSDALNEELAVLSSEIKRITLECEKLKLERDEYKKLYLSMLEQCRKLELGILQKRERYSTNDSQLALPILEMLTGNAPITASNPAEALTEEKETEKTEKVNEKKPRAKPTGRKPLPEKLPRVDIEILPLEVQRAGLDAFERIGEDVTETVEKRQASLVVVRVHKPKFALKNRDRLAETEIFQASPPDLPIERGLAGPGLLADTVVKRFQDHLPLHRLENIYGREGLELPRSTVCGWHFELAALAKRLIDAMWIDAFTAPYLCVDATGVLVQAINKCRNAHFWVVAAPELHVLFAYSAKHDSAAVDKMLFGYKGYLVADAHAVYDHLYKEGTIIECDCWAHARRYFFKALKSDPERAHHALILIRDLFLIERETATSPPEIRLQIRKEKSKPIVDVFFEWCQIEAHKVLDETPIWRAIRYAINQRTGLERFLEDGRLPIHNNFSERQLRREARGRDAWLFVGNDEGGEVNATFVTLLASCQLHGIEPYGYLRDLFCLLPWWPQTRVLELAPAYWKKTLENQDTQQRLAADIFRTASLGELNMHCPTK